MSDPYSLQRFIDAQAENYRSALAEITAGRKLTHWMWYVFPQYRGLGYTATSRHFAIKSLPEARAYLQHPMLGARLVESVATLLSVEQRSAREIFGTPDDLKLKSCATLFAQLAPGGSDFEQVLHRYFAGQRDQQTLALIEQSQ